MTLVFIWFSLFFCCFHWLFSGCPWLSSGFLRLSKKHIQMNMTNMNPRSTTHGSTTYSVHISQLSTTDSSEAVSFPFFIRRLFKEKLRIQMNMIQMNRRSATIRTYVRTYVHMYECNLTKCAADFLHRADGERGDPSVGTAHGWWRGPAVDSKCIGAHCRVDHCTGHRLRAALCGTWAQTPYRTVMHSVAFSDQLSEKFIPAEGVSTISPSVSCTDFANSGLGFKQGSNIAVMDAPGDINAFSTFYAWMLQCQDFRAWKL